MKIRLENIVFSTDAFHISPILERFQIEVRLMLHQTGVAPRVDVPTIGENLQDHRVENMVIPCSTIYPYRRENVHITGPRLPANTTAFDSGIISNQHKITALILVGKPCSPGGMEDRNHSAEATWRCWTFPVDGAVQRYGNAPEVADLEYNATADAYIQAVVRTTWHFLRRR
ncbi:hypothetical protein PspLS_06337 [Pyricularia sp. CBS 133598]|nr:hypothetical protein PspLS_06337 [Pyricularia sp. CBS 133598]